MRNVAVLALAATLTLGAVCLTACAPEAPEAPGGVEAPADPVDVPCGGTVSGEQEVCNEQ